MRTVIEDLTCLYAARIGSQVKPRDTLQNWTRATKDILTGFATQHQWQSICTGLRNHEFLLDFLAIDPDTADVQLAVESEWGPLGAVMHEFAKLLYVKSDLKIMICSPAVSADKLCARLGEIASKYPRHIEGEVYVVVDVNQTGMCISSYIWMALTDGPAQVEFHPFLDAIPFAFVARAAG